MISQVETKVLYDVVRKQHLKKGSHLEMLILC